MIVITTMIAIIVTITIVIVINIITILHMITIIPRRRHHAVVSTCVCTHCGLQGCVCADAVPQGAALDDRPNDPRCHSKSVLPPNFKDAIPHWSSVSELCCPLMG
eukprot:4223544-Amphidinium_carterae.1